MKLSNLTYATLLAATLAPVTAAHAEEDFSGSAGVEHGSRFPVQFVDRPLVMPTKMLGINLALPIAHISIDTGFGTASDTAIGLVGGVSYGLIDNLEVGATVLPLDLSPDFHYGNPSVYGMYRLLDQGGLELGAMAELRLPVRDGSHTELMLGIPVAYHFGHAARLDTGINLGFEFGDETMLMPGIPLRLHYQATNEVAVGLLTAINFPEFKGEGLNIPLAVDAIYSLPKGSMPLADIGVSFGFPLFLTPGVDVGDKVHTELWTLTLFGTYYMDI